MKIENKLQTKLSQIKVLLLDVDGVLTDGKIYYLSEQEGWTCGFHVRDGYGIKRLQKRGIEVAIISAAKPRKAVLARAELLGIKKIAMGNHDKVQAFHDMQDQFPGLNMENFAFMGDDLPDLELLKKVGVSAAPIDAITEVTGTVDFISSRQGGSGAVREFAELILANQT